MSVIARQFARPRGLLGRLIGHGMARGNGEFNRWLVREVEASCGPNALRIVELGPGPGIGLQEILRAFPEARVWGLDPSPVMLSQSRKRNIDEIRSGRLLLVKGDLTSLADLAPVDLVLAAHVIYFWPKPGSAMAQIHGALRPDGLLALGYQLKANMPGPAQVNFPKEGHLLYESDDDVAAPLQASGFRSVRFTIQGPVDAPYGRLALAEA